MAHFVEGELAVVDDQEALAVRMIRKSSWEFAFVGDTWEAINSSIRFIPDGTIVIVVKDNGYDLDMLPKTDFIIVVYEGNYYNIYRHSVRSIDD